MEYKYVYMCVYILRLYQTTNGIDFHKNIIQGLYLRTILSCAVILTNLDSETTIAITEAAAPTQKGKTLEQDIARGSLNSSFSNAKYINLFTNTKR